MRWKGLAAKSIYNTPLVLPRLLRQHPRRVEALGSKCMGVVPTSSMLVDGMRVATHHSSSPTRLSILQWAMKSGMKVPALLCFSINFCAESLSLASRSLRSTDQTPSGSGVSSCRCDDGHDESQAGWERGKRVFLTGVLRPASGVFEPFGVFGIPTRPYA